MARLDDDELRPLLPPNVWSQYQREARRLPSKIRREFKKEEDLETEQIQNEIDTNREHDLIVNLCTRPFEARDSEIRKLGYGFVRADPLYEVKENNNPIPNFDFFVCKPRASTPILIFGEAKSEITHYGKEFSDISSKIDGVRKNLGLIMKDYLHFENFSKQPIVEHVLAIKSDIVDQVLYNVAKEKFEIILWKVNIFSRKLSLVRQMKVEGFTPPVHKDHDLDRVLSDKSGGIVSRKFQESVFPQSIMLSKLRVIIETIDLERKPYVIEAESLRKKLLSHLYYLGENAIDNEVSSIIRAGLAIEFIEADKELPSGTFRVTSKAPRWEGLDKAITKKWIQSKLREKEKTAFEKARVDLQNKYVLQTRKGSTLFSLAGMQEPPFAKIDSDSRR